ncbi:MAG: AMP-binding protein [Archaeoglobaceae archaeon]|nr:AMP-binding protein [Archaeoglobaceae archaeon]MDW8117816.1 AMP-binding protein [Archaeoglobaceae archaeon]
MYEWIKSYNVLGLRESIEIPEIPISKLLDDSAKEFSENIACSFREVEYRYSEVLDFVNRLSSYLSKRIEKGDRVLLCLPNCPEFLISEMAVLKAGGICAITNPLQGKAEVNRSIERVKAKFVVSTEVVNEKVPHIVVEHEKRDEFWSTIRDSEPECPEVKINPKEDVAVILFTGGVTGLPKGVMLTHYNITANVFQVLPWILGGALEAFKGSAVLLALPITHSYGHWALHTGVSWATNIIMIPNPSDYDDIAEKVNKYKPLLTVGVPKQYMKLLSKDVDFTLAISGSAPLPKVVAEKHMQKNPLPIIEGYGLTETSPVTHVNIFAIAKFLGKEVDPKIGSIGVPVVGTEAKIVKENGSEAKIGEVGELCIRGPQVMKGYWEAESPIRDGWLYTGDLAYMDEDGFFFIVGRSKEMINVSGYKVYPRIVEETLLRHPAVEMCAVIGVPKKDGSEIVKAFVKLKAGEKAKPEELIEFCAKELPKYAVPREIEIRDNLPTNYVQKILKRLLLEEELKKLQ